jgi:hypothetical protein
MKKLLLPLALLLAAGGYAAEKNAPAKKEVVIPKDYPTAVCVVSGDDLGEMGAPFEYIHKEAGKPDRKILFCCDGCVKDFKADPAKFLAKLDEAAKAKAAGKPDKAPESKQGEHEHQH